jgi:adhesin/invasin
MVNDIGGNTVADGTQVTFITSLGTLGSNTITKTTTSGVATAVLTSGTTAGTAVITATADSKYDVTEVVFNPDPPYTVTLTADPLAIPANGVSTSTLRATVTDQYGNPVADWTAVTFTTDLGSLGSSSVIKFTTGGVATVTLTSSETGLAAVTATCGGKGGQTNVLFYSYLFELHLPLVLKSHFDSPGLSYETSSLFEALWEEEKVLAVTRAR